MESTARLDWLERRIARLERRNRWMIGLCAMLGVLALAGFTRRQERVVRAEKFELADARGRVVSEWAVERNGPVLRLGSFIEPHVRIGFYGPGNPGNPGVQIAGEQGRLRINLGLERDVDATALFMYGPEPVGSGVSSGITLVHAPRFGPSLLMKEQNRTVFRMPAQ